jgi:hypothetical protein
MASMRAMTLGQGLQLHQTHICDVTSRLGMMTSVWCQVLVNLAGCVDTNTTDLVALLGYWCASALTANDHTA